MHCLFKPTCVCDTLENGLNIVLYMSVWDAPVALDTMDNSMR